MTLNKPKFRKKKSGKKLDLINEPEEKGMSEKDQPDNSIENDPLGLIEPLIKENPDELISQIKEEINTGSQKKESKSSKKSKKTSAAQAAAPLQEDEDLMQADESMEPIQGWDFAAQTLPARKKQSFLSKLGSWAAYYSGKTIGKIGGIIAVIAKGIWDLFTPGPGTFRGTFNRLRGSGRIEHRGDRSNIPGWDGAKYENESVRDDEVDLDFRRVPELWAWPTAGKATEGDEKKRDSKPLDPVISVYISQASEK